MLPPRSSEKGHPPRPPQQRSLSVHSHQLPPQQQVGQKQSQHELRKAYKAQVSPGSNRSSFDDHGSMSSASAANSGATPSSVYMPSIALSRDVSDLSGLSGGTRASSVPGQIFDPKSFQRPWRQAYALSAPPPAARRREQDGKAKSENDRNKSKGASIWVAQNDVVEIFDNLQASFQNIILSGQDQQHNRIPIMVLLMDPNRHVYELMQIWVDRANDSIRDLMQALQQKLQIVPSEHQNQPMKSSLPSWKQAYDGIFQVRGQRFTQLINIIRLGKYDIQPHEILIAKPWSMNAKLTIAFAGTVIRHLRNVGVISAQGYVPEGLSGAKPNKNGGSTEDAALLLSKKAQERAYFPEGILSHHHAVQFVSFQPPFEKSGPIPAVGAALSPSQDDGLSSLGSLSSDRHDVKNVIASLGIPNRNRNGNPPSPKSVAELQMANKQVPSKGAHVSSRRIQHPQSGELMNQQDRRSSSDDARLQSQQKPARRGFFSKLNCCRANANEKSQGAGVHTMHKRGDDSVSSMTPSGVRQAVAPHPYRETSLTSLSEEEELQWLAYSMQPIAEDQSLNSASIVSMSAPLLKSPITEHGSNSQQQRASAGSFPQARPYGSGQDMYEF
ncbi:MAG: hypothetical protein SGILL_007546 [Bacillariaceae sp.]